MICQICKQEMKLVPAGFSQKTQKSYNAFWACPNKCKQPPMQAPTPVQNFTGQLDKSTDEAKWKEISTGKVRHGFAIEAFKMEMPLDVKTATLINAWTRFVMENKLAVSAPQPVDPSEYPIFE